jgi:hypothetical protein
MNTFYEFKCSLCNRSVWHKGASLHCSVDGTLMIKQINGDTLVQSDSKDITGCCGVPLEEMKECSLDSKENLNLHLNSENN